MVPSQIRFHCTTTETPVVLLFCFFRAAPLAYGGSQARAESELQLPAYTTATATPDPSRAYNLHHSSWQRWILNPLSEAEDQIHNFIEMESYLASSLLWFEPGTSLG